MDQHREVRIDAKISRNARLVWGTASFLVLILVGVLDFVFGLSTAFSLLFLVPIAMATRFISVRVGRLFCVVIASLLVVQSIHADVPLAQMVWNVGVRYGVCLTFVTLLDFIGTREIYVSTMRIIGSVTGLTLTCAVALSTIAWTIRDKPTQSSIDTTATRPANPIAPMEIMAARLDEMIRTSRPVLLGSRDPKGPSCVTVVTRGQVLEAFSKNLDDLDGGPGVRMAMLYYFDRREFHSLMQDFVWHQTRFATYFRNQRIANREAAQIAHEAYYEAMRLYQRLQASESLPDNVKPVGYRNDEDWAGYCMTSLDRAVEARDLIQARRWAAELVGATFAFDDLHRWYEFLIENQLLALDFQKSCKTLFENAEKTRGFVYDPNSSIGNFPAGSLSVHGVSNFLEIERQAEQLYAIPEERIEACSRDVSSELYWVMPELRVPFLELKSALGTINQLTWSDAVSSPYHRSFVMNMLYRATRAKTMEMLTSAFKKLESATPNADANELLDVLMYRGNPFGGLEWDDRFQPELVKAGQDVPESHSNAQALMDACRWTNGLFNPDKYGMTFTLRDSIEWKQLDCNRATDMIGAIFRNAGRARFGNIRWCAESTAHTVAAYLGVQNNTSQTLIVDALDPKEKPEVWPDAYFSGHKWPDFMPQNPPAYAVELYGRGLDNYIWLEGYVVRGPNAGYLTTAAVPFSQIRQQYTTQKVFDGPYPK